VTGPTIVTAPETHEDALAALRSTEAEARRLAVAALAAHPSVARSVLCEALADEDWRVRKQAVALALAVNDRVDVVELLVGVLAGPSDAVALRNAAVEALVGIGGRAVLAVDAGLARGAFDADGRKLAVEVLGGSRSPLALPALVRSLDDEDRNVRGAAAEAIGLLGIEDAAPALMRLLGQGDVFLQLAALEGLLRIGARVPAAMLRTFAEHRMTRAAAIALLGRSADDSAAPLLCDALADSSPHVGEAAVGALGTLLADAPQTRGTIAATLAAAGSAARARLFALASAESVAERSAAIELLALLPDDTALDAVAGALLDDAIAEQAVSALGAANERGVAAVRRAIAKSDPSARAQLVSVLPRLHPPPLEEARMALRDADTAVAAAGASAYAQLLNRVEVGPGAAAAADVRALITAAGSSSARLAALALSALRTLARHAPDTVRSHLVEGVDGPIEPRDDAAAVSCALLAVVGDESNVPWLSRALSAASPRVRRASVDALGAIGGVAAAEAIALAVADESLDVVLAAIKALGRVRSAQGKAPGACTLLELLRTDPSSERDRAVVVASLRSLGATEEPGAAPGVHAMTTSSDPSVVAAALEALADLDADDARAAAIAAIAHPSKVVVRAALDVLDRGPSAEAQAPRDERVRTALMGALGHAAWEVRRRAVELLAYDGAPNARRALAARAAVEPEPAVREAIAEALGTGEHRALGSVGRSSRGGA
jgi:HEAT repeat protein